MTANIQLAGSRWQIAKWWDPNGKHANGVARTDLAERIALSVETLRKAGFVARFTEWREERGGPTYNCESWESCLCRVEIYGDNQTLIRARNHLRGFWAAIESRGLTADYQRGFATGVRVLQSVGETKPRELPKATNVTKRLKA